MPNKKQPASKRPGKYNASFLRQPDQDRYLALRRKTSPSKEEQAEQLTLLRMAEENRRYVSRVLSARPHIECAAFKLRQDPDNPVVQRELLRTIVAPCYPDFFQVEAELLAQGKHKPPLARLPGRD